MSTLIIVIVVAVVICIISAILFHRKGFIKGITDNKLQHELAAKKQQELFDERYKDSLEKNQVLYNALVKYFIGYINLKITYYRSYKAYTHFIKSTPDKFILTIEISKSKYYSVVLDTKYFDLIKAERGDTIDLVSWSKISSLTNLILDNKI